MIILFRIFFSFLDQKFLENFGQLCFSSVSLTNLINFWKILLNSLCQHNGKKLPVVAMKYTINIFVYGHQ